MKMDTTRSPSRHDAHAGICEGRSNIMTRGLAVLGSAVFFLIAPTTVAGVVPWWISRWRLQAPFFDLQLIRWFGVVLILLGIPVLVDTFTRFALQGGGTP